ERVVKRVEKLEDAPLRVLAELDSAAKRLRGRVEDDELDFALFAERRNSRRQLVQHALVQEIVFRPVESEARDFAIHAVADKLKFFNPRKPQSRNRPDELVFTDELHSLPVQLSA